MGIIQHLMENTLVQSRFGAWTYADKEVGSVAKRGIHE